MLIKLSVIGIAVACILQSLAIRALTRRIEELEVAITARCTGLNATCKHRHNKTKETQ